jgi:hypothetical protein
MHGAWGPAHGVANLKYNLDLKLLRFALCALLYAICLETVTSDEKPVTGDNKADTRNLKPIPGRTRSVKRLRYTNKDAPRLRTGHLYIRKMQSIFRDKIVTRFY